MEIYEEKVPFKVEDDKQNEMKTPPPQCIVDLKANPKRQDLTNKQMRVAEKELLNNNFTQLRFPRERKFRVDPAINGQTFCVTSFFPSAGATPDKDGCYGVMKVRGSFSTQHEAEQWAKMLMRKHDTLAEFDITYVGRDFPLMKNNECYSKETTEVNLQATMDDITLGWYKSKRNEEKRDRDSVEQRHQKLIGKKSSQEPDYEEDLMDDLEKYTQLRTKIAYAKLRVEESNKHKSEAEKALEKFNEELEAADAQNPTFRHQFLAKYEEGLAKIGVDKSKNTYIQYMKDEKDVSDIRSNNDKDNKDSDEEEKKEPLTN